MNANCIICSDLFQARSDTYATSCGHIFHFICLIQWMERSKTCPQCRHKETEKTIHRVYFNVPLQQHIPDDIVTIQAKLDNEKFNFKLASKKLQNALVDYKKCSTNSRTLAEMTISLQKKHEANTSAMIEMKGTLHYYKDKLRDKDKCLHEVTRLRSQIENMRHLKTVIDGGEEEVDDLIKSTTDPRTQSLFVAVLQKELTEQDRRMQKLSTLLRLNKSDYNEVKAQGFVFKKKYEELVKAKEEHKSCDAKILGLKAILAEHIKTNENINPNDSINRVIFENPAPLRADFNERFIDGDTKESPTVDQRVAQIRAADSPYLAIKSTVGNSVGHLLQAKYKVQTKGATSSVQNADKYSIFNKKVVTNPNKGEYCYDGMGGHSKEEVFPKPGMSNSSVKRSKTTITNSKFKKLNLKAVSAYTLLANKK